MVLLPQSFSSLPGWLQWYRIAWGWGGEERKKQTEDLPHSLIPRGPFSWFWWHKGAFLRNLSITTTAKLVSFWVTFPNCLILFIILSSDIFLPYPSFYPWKATPGVLSGALVAFNRWDKKECTYSILAVARPQLSFLSCFIFSGSSKLHDIETLIAVNTGLSLVTS